MTVSDAIIGIVAPVRAGTIRIEGERRGAVRGRVLVVEDRCSVDTVARVSSAQLGQSQEEEHGNVEQLHLGWWRIGSK